MTAAPPFPTSPAPVPPTPQTLSIEGLTVAAGHDGAGPVLVRELTLELRRGRVLALVGASGSGKSMTCMAALGTLPPGTRTLSGRVRLNGAECAPEALRGREVATILQNPRSAFNPVRTMRDHALETLAALGLAGAASAEEIKIGIILGFTGPLESITPMMAPISDVTRKKYLGNVRGPASTSLRVQKINQRRNR